MNQFKPNDPQKAKEYFEKKVTYTNGPIEVAEALKRGANINLIDVRAAKDFAEGHPAGAINLPQAEWDSLKGLSKDKLNILLCYSTVCHLAANAAVKFATLGFPVMEMDGGFATWKEHKLAIESGEGMRKSA